MNWNHRITVAREAMGIKKSEFSRLVGVSTATTADWETGKIKMIDGRNLVKAAQVLKVTPEWIMTGEGEDCLNAVAEFRKVFANVNDEGKQYLRGAIKGALAGFPKT
jgi:transcriptional regulator with XRE-family HTH domain